MSDQPPEVKYVALIGHDRKKEALVDFVRQHRDYFATTPLVATESTGARLNSELGLEVKLVTHGPLGGDLVIGAMIVRSQIKAVFFLPRPTDRSTPRAGCLGAITGLRRPQCAAGYQPGDRRMSDRLAAPSMTRYRSGGLLIALPVILSDASGCSLSRIMHE